MSMVEGSSAAQTPPADAVRAVSGIEFVPTVLKLVCEYTGMRWSAVTYVTDDSWTACAVHDTIEFGLAPGSQLDVNNTLCIDVRRMLTPIMISHASKDPNYAEHPVPALHCFESYVSMPILLPDGSYFGNLCALDPEPRPVSDERTAAVFEAFASLIGVYLDVERQRDNAQVALLTHIREVGKKAR